MPKVYKYWCVPSSKADNDVLCNQVKLAASYRRELALIENRSRVLQRAALDWPTTQSGIDLTDHKSIKAWRESADGRAALKTWRMSDEYKAYRKTIIDQQVIAARKMRAVWAKADLNWGTYQAVEEAMDQSRKTSPLWNNKGPNDVREFFPRDEGRVAIHIQDRKLSTNKVEACTDKWLQLDPVKYSFGARVDGFPSRGQGDTYNKVGCLRPKRMRELSFRIGSVPGTIKPVWAKLHVLLHRDLPSNINITWVFVNRERIGLQYRWSVCFVVDEVQHGFAPVVDAAITVAVDIGWRKVDGGMRVAYWMDSAGDEGQLVIPDHIMQRGPKSDSLRSIRDNNRNIAVAAFRDYLATVPSESWLKTNCENIQAWKRIGRFVMLHRGWAQNRFDGDQAPFENMAAWLKQDGHLLDWERFNVRKQINQVEYMTDLFAFQLAQKYTVIIAEDFNIQDVVKRKVGVPDVEVDSESEAESEAEDTQDEKRLRHLNAVRVQGLAPGRLRASCKSAAAKYGRGFVKINAAYTTADCAECGHRRVFVDPTLLVQTCEVCGYSEDQDRTATRNLLGAGRRMSEGGEGWPVDTDGKLLAVAAKAKTFRTTRKQPKKEAVAVVEPIVTVQSGVDLGQFASGSVPSMSTKTLEVANPMKRLKRGKAKK